MTVSNTIGVSVPTTGMHKSENSAPVLGSGAEDGSGS